MNVLLPLFALLPLALQAQGPAELETHLQSVTVFGDRALVARRAQPATGGAWVVRGLPAGLDPSSLRARATGADVLSLEARVRALPRVPNERLQALRDELRALRREEAALVDRRSLEDDVKSHLQRRLELEGRTQAASLERGEVDAERWGLELDWIATELAATRANLRTLEGELEDLRARIAIRQHELDSDSGGDTIPVHDVHLDLAARGEGPLALELEYLVARAGWRPQYDLRAAPDARSVELTFRAEVWQETGEDWTDVDLSLSTARPNLGAAGPEPEAVWLRLAEPRKARKYAGRAVLAQSEGEVDSSGFDVPSFSVFAGVESQGLSLRYRLPRRETVQSRRGGSTVLVGRERLEAFPEYHAVPSQDENVWLRGVARNTSDWTLLPGQATVFFGADYVGTANVGPVQPGAELTLHLGPDPALGVERRQTEDLTKGPGFFGSRKVQSETWIVRVRNDGALVAGPGGSARVFVHEALPRTTDKALEIELASSAPRPSDDARWQRDLEELGVRTWVLDVPRGGEAQLEYRLKLSYPQKARLVR